MCGGSQRGQALVELALVLPVLICISMGLLDLGRVFYIHTGLTNAAREGAREATRQAALQPPTCDQTLIKNRVKAEQLSLGILDGTIFINCLAAADRRTLIITGYQFQPTPFIGAMLGVGNGPLLLNTSATLPVTS